jgi:hypothetical protein
VPIVRFRDASPLPFGPVQADGKEPAQRRAVQELVPPHHGGPLPLAVDPAHRDGPARQAVPPKRRVAGPRGLNVIGPRDTTCHERAPQGIDESLAIRAAKPLSRPEGRSGPRKPNNGRDGRSRAWVFQGPLGHAVSGRFPGSGWLRGRRSQTAHDVWQPSRMLRPAGERPGRLAAGRCQAGSSCRA